MTGPLADVVIADFTQLMQGAWAAQKLGDMGADVIKIEPPGGELERSIAYEGERFNGHTPGYLSKNRNKRSVTLDLKTAVGQQAAMDIIAEADVLMENFRPGVMGRLGLSYEDVQAVNQEIIYVSGSAYGSDGPYSGRPGQDLLYQAMTGMASYTGRRGEPPTAAGTVIVDEHSATLIALYTVGALFHCRAGGGGQRIEASLLNSAIDMQCQEFTLALNTDRDLTRGAKSHGHAMLAPPYGIYETADGYVAIGMSPLETVCQTLEVTDIDPGEYDTQRRAFDARDTIHDAIEARTREFPAAELVDTLAAEDVQAVQVARPTEVPDDRQVRHNDMFIEVPHPEGGTFTSTGFPIELSETPEELRRGPPKTGEHTADVLREIGYGDAEIEAVEESLER
jgi:crotonobetainyl-CoA:carnitine CoA-transferase CaiB-like acyl-CoA transferase